MSPPTCVRDAGLCGASIVALWCLLSFSLPPASAAPDAEDVDLTLDERGRMVVNSLGMKLVRLEAGKFMMGAPDGEREAPANEKPRHEVTITRGFYLGVHE